MLELSKVKLPLDAGLSGKAAKQLIHNAAAAALGVDVAEIALVRVLKRSVDARRKSDVHFVATLGVDFADAKKEDKVLAAAQARAAVAVDAATSTGAEAGALADSKDVRTANLGSVLGVGVSGKENVRRHAAYKPLIITPRAADSVAEGDTTNVAENAAGGATKTSVAESSREDAVGRGVKDIAGSSTENLAENTVLRPLVVGSGPAGLFAALYLARAGLRPLLLERGAPVQERLQVVAAFEAGGALNLHTNIQFGEGGAGTFSDGKLTTNIKNPLTPHVLHWFFEAGAPEEILWQAKPHIGTDLLVDVVRRMREQIEEAGGEVRFYTQLTGLRTSEGTLVGADMLDTRSGVTEQLEVQQMVLACGHSARDTLEMIHEAGVHLEQKPFSVGVRIEHTQQAIDRAQYKQAAGHAALGAADYKLAVHLPGGRSVYTFCMCPGGEVVCAASEPESVVVNGMSRFARDGRNANSALLVGVGPSDFGSDHPLAGVALQRNMEQAAYRVALSAKGKPYAAPAQTVGNFLAGRSGVPSATVEPTYARGVAWCNLHECLPPFVAQALEQALPLFERKLSGFSDTDAVLTGVETRSSSPVRVVRNASYEALFAPHQKALCYPQALRESHESQTPHESMPPSPRSGLYPCGEGAGYAGGIMSAACDGLRVAQALAASLHSQDASAQQ